jgi:hypothetical protein
LRLGAESAGGRTGGGAGFLVGVSNGGGSLGARVMTTVSLVEAVDRK